jgi:hypothetical protein
VKKIEKYVSKFEEKEELQEETIDLSLREYETIADLIQFVIRKGGNIPSMDKKTLLNFKNKIFKYLIKK